MTKRQITPKLVEDTVSAAAYIKKAETCTSYSTKWILPDKKIFYLVTRCYYGSILLLSMLYACSIIYSVGSI